MATTPTPPFHRTGVRFTSNPDRNLEYLQELDENDDETVYRGELFLNEVLDELYYVDFQGIARRFGDRAPVPFSRIDFSGLREFANDSEASVASPPVSVGGLYRTGSTLKVRMV